MILHRKYDKVKLGALMLSITTGRRIQAELGDRLAQNYREGRTISTIVEEEMILQRYGISRTVAEKAVSLALRGYEGRFGGEPYSGLIGEEEMKVLARDHKSTAGSNLVEQGRGIFGPNADDYRKNGYFAKATKDERLELARLSVEARGAVPWNNDETARLFELLNAASQEGRHSRNVTIAQHLNIEFHDGKEVRNRLSVYNKSRKERDKAKREQAL